MCMMKVKTMISAIVLSLIVPAAAFAQDVGSMLDDVRMQASKAFVTVVYEAELNGPEGSFSDKGVIEAQDDLWHLKGSAVEIYTDREGTWIVDASAKEVYIEPKWTYDDLLNFYESLLSSDSDLNVKVISSSQTEKKPLTVFTPAFSPEWVVTDLR